MGFQSWVGTTSVGAPRARQFRDKKRENSLMHFQIWKICDKYENGKSVQNMAVPTFPFMSISGQINYL